MYALKRDAIENEIITALRSCGCTVYLQDDFDAIVHRGNSKQVWLMEFKSPHGRLTKQQRHMKESLGLPLHVVHSVVEALRIVGL